MKRLFIYTHFPILLCFFSSSFSQEFTATPEISIKEIDSNNSIIFIKGTKITCNIKSDPYYPKISTDKEFLILDWNKYIAIKEIEDCRFNILSKNTPERNGFLVDMNKSQNIALSLDMISTAPSRYLATLTKIGDTNNLISFPGSYTEAKNPIELQENTISYDESNPPKISPDGVYVDISGNSDCTEDAFPGVWHIKEHRKIFFTGEPDDIQRSCDALFANP